MGHLVKFHKEVALTVDLAIIHIQMTILLLVLSLLSRQMSFLEDIIRLEIQSLHIVMIITGGGYLIIQQAQKQD